MSNDEYTGYEKVLKDALVEARGKKTNATQESKVTELEKKLETAKLTQAEIAEIQKQLKLLKKN